MDYKTAKMKWDSASAHEKEMEREIEKLSEEYRVKAISHFHAAKETGNRDRAELDEISAREKAATEARTRAAIISAIWRDNAQAALLEELKPAALEVLKRYNGKPYGEKTREKISNEMHDKTGFYMSLRHEYYHSEISFYTGFHNPWSYDDLKIGFYTGQSGDKPENKPLLDGNKIRLDSFEELKAYRGEEIIEDPAARAEEIIEAYKEAEKAAAEWENAKSKYNAMIPKTGCGRIEYNDSRPRYLLSR